MENSRTIAQLAASKKILVLGSSGSGKTTLTLQLARLLHIEAVHLDACFWRVGWKSTPQDEWRAHVTELIARPAWIMDGTYESTLELRLSAADAIVVIERNRLSCLWRIVKRRLTIDDLHRPDAPPGQPIDWPFVRYVWRYPTVTRPLVYKMVHEHGDNKPLIILNSHQQMNQMLRSLDAQLRQHC